MRASGCVLALAPVLLSCSAAAQISYVSRNSFIGYFEEDFDLLTSQVTFDASDAIADNTGADFDELLVFPVNGTAFNDTTAQQFSQLFADAIVFEGRALAEEDRTDNAFGVYTAGATSQFNVVFDIAAPIDFTLTGNAFNAASPARLGTTAFSLNGPGANINVASGPLDFAGTLTPGRYELDVFIESIGRYEDGFLGIDRTRGEDLGFDALLLLGGGNPIAGDYNDSGQVEQGDLDLVLQNWGQDSTGNVPAGWTGPQPDGIIEQTELDGVLSNWGSTSAPDFTGTSVPEPSTLGALAAVGLLRRRRA